jgi:hypothetical protein
MEQKQVEKEVKLTEIHNRFSEIEQVLGRRLPDAELQLKIFAKQLEVSKAVEELKNLHAENQEQLKPYYPCLVFISGMALVNEDDSEKIRAAENQQRLRNAFVQVIAGGSINSFAKAISSLLENNPNSALCRGMIKAVTKNLSGDLSGSLLMAILASDGLGNMEE